MKQHEMWTADEKSFLDTAGERLAKNGLTDMRQQLAKSLDALEFQASALALYPSILHSNRLGGTERNLQTLVSVLSERYREENDFVIPTKALLSRSYEIGKINIFYLLKHVSNVSPQGLALFDGKDPLEFVEKRMLSIMTEDVLLDILSDPVLKRPKPEAATTLAEIWEGRNTPEAASFNPELRRMWQIRQTSVPIFGTLLGTHEYISLCRQADDISLKYILYSAEMPDEAAALEEFLFGLTYEELRTVKDALDRSGKGNFNRDEVARVLGNDNLPFSSDASGDPLELYRFYNRRRKQAYYRRCSKSQGPIRTFEENFMVFLLTGKDQGHQQDASWCKDNDTSKTDF